jgi:hypothetical protein
LRELKAVIYLFICWAIVILMGCAPHRVTMPTIDLPPEPQKPAIKSSVIVQNNTPWVAYSLNDSLKLYEYLLHKDSYEEKLRYRIELYNNYLTEKH